MANDIKLVVFPAKDVAKSKKFFSTFLGTEPYIDGEWYTGYKVGDIEVGLDPNGKAVINYIDTDDIEGSLKTLKEVDAKVVMEPKDVGGGLLVAQVEMDGNIVGLRQHAKK
jgi:predicted enzyme related to lactoylglutathione lyase